MARRTADEARKDLIYANHRLTARALSDETLYRIEDDLDTLAGTSRRLDEVGPTLSESQTLFRLAVAAELRLRQAAQFRAVQRAKLLGEDDPRVTHVPTEVGSF